MADEQDDAQKTEQPTPKKLQDARDKGQVASSKEVNNFFLIAAGTLVLGFGGPDISAQIKTILAPFVTQAASLPTNQAGLSDILVRTLLDVAFVLIVPFLALIIAALASGWIQDSILWSFESLKPKVERISPIAGFKRLFSLKSIVEFLKSIFKIAFVAMACAVLLIPKFSEIISSTERSTLGWLGLFDDLMLMVLISSAVIVAVFAGLDYGYQHFEFMKQMRMTKQEVKDEHKQTDGDPLIKQRLRQLRMDKASKRMMAEVPSSTVVITNPTHFSVALKYDRDTMSAPVVVAKGIDEVALRIRTIAREHDVPLYENPPLARTLFAQAELGETIPVEQYQAVAEIIGYVMRLAADKQQKW